MTYDPDPLPAGNRLLRVLLASFRLGVAFGVEVRMYALAAVLVVAAAFNANPPPLPRAAPAARVRDGR